MNFVLVFPLILALISCGQCHTEEIEQTNSSCYSLCPAGYHRVSNCDDGVKFKCKKCEAGTFIDLPNYSERCFRCVPCDHDEMVIEHCTFNRSTVCDCKDGYYNSRLDNIRHCEKCTRCTRCQHNNDYRAKCQPTQRVYPASTNPSTTAPVSTITVANEITTASTSAPAPSAAPVSTSKAFTKQPNPRITLIPPTQLQLVVSLAVVSFLLLLWFLLIFTMKIFKHKDRSSCWRKSKDVEVSQNEQPSHQGSNPTTLTLTVSEETPMFTQSRSPAVSEHPTNISPLVPVNGQIGIQ